MFKNLIFLFLILFVSCKKDNCIPNGICNDESFVFGTKCYVDSVCKGFGGTKFFNDCDLHKDGYITVNDTCP